jgi:glutathione synthase
MLASLFPPYPPSISPNQLATLKAEAKDWQTVHGALNRQLFQPFQEDPLDVLSFPHAVTLFPSLFPKRCFEEAWQIQTIFNELYCAVATDEEWLFRVLEEYCIHFFDNICGGDLYLLDRTFRIHPFYAKLWEIHLTIKEISQQIDWNRI